MEFTKMIMIEIQANYTTQEVGAVLSTATVQNPQEAVEVRKVLERGVEIVTISGKVQVQIF